MGIDYKGKMITYICCKQGGNNCPKREECRRYLDADKEVSWALFKHVCTEENDFQLFMEKLPTEIMIVENTEDKEISEQNNGDANT